ncbi:MAG: MATE family efflux transporter [Atopobiaceae bacterium]|nr:MATE family efflux transporter [Atopobiaceae bacterium]
MKSLVSLIAPKEQTPEEKRREMLERPITPLMFSLAIPSIFANVVTTLYNLADAFFVGQMGSTSASAAVGVSIVTSVIIQSMAFYLAQGTGIQMSRCLGAGNTERASEFVNTGIAGTVVLGTLIALIGHLLLDQLCYLGGATPTILPYARTYISIILFGAPFIGSGFLMNMQLRFQGESFYSMLCMVAGALLNTILTPLFIFPLGLGIAGSALATVVSEAISFFLLLFEMKKAGITKLGLRYVRIPDLTMLREINNGGVPSFVRQIMFGVATSLLNNAAAPFGDAAIASIAVVQRITSVANFLQIGVGQGFQPITGYNLGAKRYDRIREAFFTAVKASFVSVAAIGVITFVFAPQLIALFRDDPDVVAFGTLTLRLQSITMPFTGVAMATNFLLQTSGKMWRATFMGACRLGLVLGPVVLALPRLLGMLGVQIAQPVTDILTTLIAIPMAVGMIRELVAAERAQKNAPAEEPSRL